VYKTILTPYQTQRKTQNTRTLKNTVIMSIQVLPFFSSCVTDENKGFSNFHMVDIKEGDKVFKSSEHYYMYYKAIQFGDLQIAEKILDAKFPYKAKKLGAQVSNYDDRIWKKHREQVMENGLTLKFTQHQDLRNRLVATSPKILVEASPYDKVWGVGLSEDDPRINDPIKWKGKNLLGKVLMRVRDKIMNKPKPKQRTIQEILLIQYEHLPHMPQSDDEHAVKSLSSLSSSNAESIIHRSSS
jgi:ribA/ribD-fused uncharacterized protein